MDVDKRAVLQPMPDEKPVPATGTPTYWGSDAVAVALRALDIPFIALNPGASFRGLHDSLVNHLGNERPQMLLCLHEEHAVGVAHGYYRVSGRMMAAAVHANVGLMHATMPIFNAWCDRVPVLVLGATGPVDAARRRPWIDWIHTARDQGALVRDYTKWDDQPASAAAAQESILRATLLANTAPRGPVYVCLDAGLQESRLEAAPALPDPSRFAAPPSAQPAPDTLAQAARLLDRARRPVMLAGRVGRAEQAWRDRVALAEKLGARVLTDIKQAAAFPTDHPQHALPATTFLSPGGAEILREADVILSLDWNDLAGTLKTAFGAAPVTAKVIQASVDLHGHRGWSMDHQGLPPVDCHLLAEPDVVVPLLLGATTRATPASVPVKLAAPKATTTGSEITVASLAAALNDALGDAPACFIRVPLSWSGEYRHFRHPLDYIGSDGGAGIGSGPGMAVGAALALRGSARIPVALTGDGDFLMGVTALWTATHFRIPLLVVVANNRSFFNDELHQERIARERDRPVENRWIGQRIAEPDIDLAALGRAQGTLGVGPVSDPARLALVLREAIDAVRGGAVAVVDVRVAAGYAGAMVAGMMRTRKAEGKS
ncbi:MAG TPA: thiamine pyrophosphate-binding protein [Burkholderiales bacterium]|nr:thiamine pyrophosphate-binding protein [Burkholderiales bacterium]